ncbi:peroxiredoxin [Atopobium minutum]|nr:peroxiredoxin [Atopobium minutum]
MQYTTHGAAPRSTRTQRFLGGTMSLIGKEISDFSVQAYVNDDFKTVTKADVLGKWSLFFFYPADFTFVCPTELEELAEIYADFQAEGCEVYSVSCDTHFVHKAWHEESERIAKVTYPMLADPAHVLAQDFEVLIENDGLAERGAFIVDPEGRIQVYEVTAGGIGRNAKELLRLVQAAKFVAEHGDQVCPAKWQPGGETLKPSLDLVGML